MGYQTTSSPLGFSAGVERNRCIARGGARSRSDVMQLDLAMTDPATTNNEIGLESSGLVNLVTPASGQLPHGIFCVLEQAAADDAKVWVTFSGFVEAYLIKASGDIEPGDMLVVTTGGNLSPDGALGGKAVGIFLPLDGVAMSAPTTRTRGRVYFDGENGVGVHAG